MRRYDGKVRPSVLPKPPPRAMSESTPKIYAEVFAIGYVEAFAAGYAEGRINEARTTLLRLGAKKLGPPGERIEAEIATMGDVDRLNDLSDRVHEVSTWEELARPCRSASMRPGPNALPEGAVQAMPIPDHRLEFEGIG